MKQKNGKAGYNEEREVPFPFRHPALDAGSLSDPISYPVGDTKTGQGLEQGMVLARWGQGEM